MLTRSGRNAARRARETRESLQKVNKDLQTARNAQLIAEADARQAKDQAELAVQDALHIRRMFEAIASLVARESMLAGEPTMLNEGSQWDVARNGDCINIAPVEPVSWTMPLGPEESVMTITSEVVRLMQVEKVRDRMKGVVHVRVNLVGRATGYGISEKALRGMTARELQALLIPEVSRSLLRLLTEEIKQVYR